MFSQRTLRATRPSLANVPTTAQSAGTLSVPSTSARFCGRRFFEHSCVCVMFAARLSTQRFARAARHKARSQRLGSMRRGQMESSTSRSSRSVPSSARAQCGSAAQCDNARTPLVLGQQSQRSHARPPFSQSISDSRGPAATAPHAQSFPALPPCSAPRAC